MRIPARTFINLGLAITACLLALNGWGFAADKDGEDDRRGAIWSYKATHGTSTKEGQFRINNYKIFKGKQPIGKIEAEKKGKSKLIFEDYPELNGEINVERTSTKPVVWEGKHTDGNGKNWKVRFEVKDR